ncbi:DUF2007 domain-containing protein [Carboxydothermus ferrireducens]|uniref:Signal transducing protein n=1 Tax=Carboxydothermus ferrireducens DSM 11255 TaxID=1119529 RepID=A0ABX2R7K7_9THEO|nr:DUF2007 domain-containing protein [Carboxydothermus ferrireducens]NYE57045.1 hypothetical protein [Carboxydothermus ferrireducens DSM 11255]
MWTVVYIAPNKKEALRVQEALAKEGFLVKIKPIGIEGDNSTYEVMVPEAEVEEAMEILNEM